MRLHTVLGRDTDCGSRYQAEQKLQLLSPGVNRNPALPKGNQVITLMKCTGAFFFFFFWLHLSNSICYVIQSLSPVCLFGTRWTTARQASLFFTISQSLLKLKSIELVGDAIQPSHPLLSPSPPAFQSFPASGSFPMSWLCISGGQSIGASASVFPMNIQD